MNLAVNYQRFLSPGFKPFNPIKLAEETEKIVTRKGEDGLERKYTDFYSVPVYRGIATGYAIGLLPMMLLLLVTLVQRLSRKIRQILLAKAGGPNAFQGS